MIDLRYLESAAYHEAGHTVVAAVQSMPLRNRGVRIDASGDGIAFYFFRLPDGSRNVGSDVERERTIIATCAGQIAQQKFYPDCPTGGAVSDYQQVVALLNEMYPDGPAWYAARYNLFKQSEALVDQHWPAIEALAAALWAKPWTLRPPETERNWSQLPDEKWVDGSEVVSILQGFQIPAFIVEDSVRTYTPTAQT